MSDIAFLLIIFFMVTAVFSATKGLSMRLPEEDDETGKPDPDPGVFIEVFPDQVRVDCHVMTPEEILPYLEPILTANPRKPVILLSSPDAEYRQMIEIYDLLGSTRDAESPWPFAVEDIFVPTSADIAAYVEVFDTNPLATRCN